MKFLSLLVLATGACVLPVGFVAANQDSGSARSPLTNPDHEPVESEIEEIVVTAPRIEPLGGLRQRLARLLVDDPGGVKLELLPAADDSQLQALEERYMRELPIGRQFEPAGGAQLFRLTLDRR